MASNSFGSCFAEGNELRDLFSDLIDFKENYIITSGYELLILLLSSNISYCELYPCMRKLIIN